ncbi:MAG: hypothetical protein ACK5HS_02665 [Mycoplasmatales bacterium]
MNEKDRIESIKDGLKKNVYEKAQNIELSRDLDEESTGSLANILEGYIEKIDTIDVNTMEEFTEELKTIKETEVEVELVENSDEFVKEYNNHIHSSLEKEVTKTLDNVMPMNSSVSGSVNFDSQPLPKNTEDISPKVETKEIKIKKEETKEEKVLQTTVESTNPKIEDTIDDLEIYSEETYKHNKNKNNNIEDEDNSLNVIDYVLFVVLAIIIIVLIYLVLSLNGII